MSEGNASSIGKVNLDLGLNYKQFNRQLSDVQGTATGKIGSAFKKLGILVGGAFAVKKVWDFGKVSTQMATSVAINEAKLTTIMRQRMGATDDVIGSIKRLTDAQEALGVVDAASQVAGTQELATYLSKASSLQTLIPVMNDLVAQQYGLNSSSEQVTQMASMLGKVMDGQVGALSRYGFTFDEAQEKVLKYGEESEKAALLVDIVRDSLGDMNAALGRTPEGQWKQLSFTMGRVREELGSGIKVVLQQLLPYLNAVANAFLRAAQYATALARAIFGSNKAVADSAGVAAKAQGELGGAVKDAGKDVKGSLSNFDQLNVITQNAADNMDDMASAGIGDALLADVGPIGPEIDISKFQPLFDALDKAKSMASDVGQYMVDAFGPSIGKAIDSMMPHLAKWRDAIYKTFGDIADLGGPFKAWMTDDLTPFLQKNIEYLGEVWSGLLESAEMVFSGIWDAAMPVLEWFVKDGLPMITEFGSGCMDIFKSVFDLVKKVFDSMWKDAVKPGLDLLSKMTVDTLNIIKKFWDKFGKDIMDGLKGYIDNLKKTFENLWDKVLGPAFKNAIQMLSDVWDEHFKGVVEDLFNFVGELMLGVLEIYDKFIVPLVNYLIDKLGPIFLEVFDYVVGIIKTSLIVIADVAKGIIRSLGGIIEFLVGIFTGDWQRAWDGVKEIVAGVFDSIVGVVKGAVNLIIDAVNFMTTQLNKLSWTVPDWVPVFGGRSFAFNLPQIPKLANGGLVSAPTLAMVGDNRNAAVDPEVVTPLSKLQDMLGVSNQAVVEVLLMVLDAIERLDLSVDIDGEKLTRLVRDGIRQEDSRVGRSAVTIGGASLR